MTLPVYHEDLCELFDRADCTSIFSRRSKAQVTLADYEPGPKSEDESILAIKAIIEAVVYLRMNLIMPCQLKFSYIIRCNGRWGICHAICERSEEMIKEDEDSYNPEEYIFHLDSENQLVWNIGQVWLRFFTKETIKIKLNVQKKVDKLIDSCVQNQEVNQLLKRVLCLDKVNRIRFEELLAEEILATQEEEQTKFYCSLMCHLKNMSSIMGSKAGLSKFVEKNPFARELNYRRFLEYLEIDIFLENVKSDIRKEYVSEEEDQKFTYEFTSFIMMLQSYKNMIKLNTERLEMGERFEEINDRIYYAKFTKRMIMLRELVEKKARVLKNNPYMRKNLVRYLDDPDSISEEVVYTKFKNCLSEYVEYLSDDLKINKNDTIARKLLAKIFIARTSGYIFNHCRVQLFQPLLKQQKTFTLKKIHSKINDCTDNSILQALILNIQEFYFKI